jgi:hypothetical protein
VLSWPSADSFAVGRRQKLTFGDGIELGSAWFYFGSISLDSKIPPEK